MHSTRRRAASNGKRRERHQRERAPLAGIERAQGDVRS
jgi:hypothetical protein